MNEIIIDINDADENRIYTLSNTCPNKKMFILNKHFLFFTYLVKSSSANLLIQPKHIAI